jgi:hypothetical protein
MCLVLFALTKCEFSVTVKFEGNGTSIVEAGELWIDREWVHFRGETKENDAFKDIHFNKGYSDGGHYFSVYGYEYDCKNSNSLDKKISLNFKSHSWKEPQIWIKVTITFSSVQDNLIYLLNTGVCQKYQAQYLLLQMMSNKNSTAGFATDGYISQELIPNVAFMAYNATLATNKDIYGTQYGSVVMKGNKFCFDSELLFGYEDDRTDYFDGEDISIKVKFLTLFNKSKTFRLACRAFDRADVNCGNVETNKNLNNYSANVIVRYRSVVITGRDAFIGVFPTSSKIDRRAVNATFYFINYESYSKVMNGLCALKSSNENLTFID